MAQTTVTEVPGPLTELYQRTMLDNLWPNLLFKRFGVQPVIVSRGSGSLTVKWRRPGKITASTTTLTEGTTPTPSTWSKSDLTAAMLQKGDFIQYTDLVDVSNFSENIDAMVQVLAMSAADAYDQLCRDVVVAGTSVRYSSGDANRAAVAHLPTTTDLDICIRTLKSNNAAPVTQMINAGTGVGSVPVAPCYIGICHPHVSYTLKGLTGFSKVETYSDRIEPLPGEIGKYMEIRFLESTNASINTGAGAAGATYRATGGNYDVYYTMILGQGAYGGVNLDSEIPEIIVKAIGSSGTADALNQRGTVGWKGYNIDKILDDNRMIRLETCAAL